MNGTDGEDCGEGVGGGGIGLAIDVFRPSGASGEAGVGGGGFAGASRLITEEFGVARAAE